MPAKKNPVINLKNNKLPKLCPDQITPRFANAPDIAQRRKTREGENRSAREYQANTSVPPIKPNCTAEVNPPKACGDKSKSAIRLFITPLLANHREVQQNWATTITGRM